MSYKKICLPTCLPGVDKLGVCRSLICTRSGGKKGDGKHLVQEIWCIMHLRAYLRPTESWRICFIRAFNNDFCRLSKSVVSLVEVAGK